jgi:hypothetical protein
MGCDRVVVSKTATTGVKTTIDWLKYSMADLTGFLIVLVQDSHPTPFEAKSTDTSLTVDFSAKPLCKVTVTPKDANGPVNDRASFAADVPFPPTPLDPDKGRPIVLRVCADDTTVTVNWVASKLPDLEGNYITIVKGSEKLTNFPVEGPTVVAYTAEYKCEPGFSYEVFVTPYDWSGPGPASYPVKIPYP